MRSLVVVLFWLAVVALAYGYAGYPLLVAAAGRLLDRRVRRAPITPRLSLIVAAYNEEASIAERVENALTSDYPPDALEVIVASDGSTDGTEAVVAAYAERGVRLLSLPRRGKIHALADAVRRASGEILVFSDANIEMHPQALRALARNFADPSVGGVAANAGYRLPHGGEGSSRGEGLYWRYDTWLKEMESRTGSVVSAHGGLYAIRRSLFQEPRETAVTDDFAISTAVVAQGARLVFDRDALAYETAIAEAGREFDRKIRLMTRAWRSVALRRELLNPFRHGFYAVVLFSHKVLRRLLPIPLLVLAVASVALAPRGGVYAAAAWGQAVFYGLAGLGWLTRRTRLAHLKPIYVPFYYCLANAAAVLALFRFLRGERIVLWQPQRHAAGTGTTG
jgi:cellulose synthase/poly-beta-1,6-N-acetylglucosamine synthase-like glycosyltransferase